MDKSALQNTVNNSTIAISAPTIVIDEDTFFCDDRKDGYNIEPIPITIFKELEPAEHPFDGCFVTAVFGISEGKSDKITDATEMRTKYPNYDFILFTNLVNLDAESKGWRKVLHFDTSKKRMITVSRHPKFLAWKERYIQNNCPVVFYLDGTSSPSGSVAEFDQLKKEILESREGVAQLSHIPLEQELNDIVKFKKDTKEHISGTRAWIYSQPDIESWEDPKHTYLNTFIGEKQSVSLCI